MALCLVWRTALATCAIAALRFSQAPNWHTTKQSQTSFSHRFSDLEQQDAHLLHSMSSLPVCLSCLAYDR